MDVYVYMDAVLAECRGEVRVPELGQKLTEFSVRVVSTLKHSHFQPCLCRDFSVVARCLRASGSLTLFVCEISS